VTRDRESHRREREERVELHGVLDLDEGDPPDRGDDDQGEERRRAIVQEA
jgi:hypothetical protein